MIWSKTAKFQRSNSYLRIMFVTCKLEILSHTPISWLLSPSFWACSMHDPDVSAVLVVKRTPVHKGKKSEGFFLFCFVNTSVSLRESVDRNKIRKKHFFLLINFNFPWTLNKRAAIFLLFENIFKSSYLIRISTQVYVY